MTTPTRIMLLILFPIVGAIIGYSFAALVESGQFVQWQAIAGLPDKATKIVWSDESGVWVETQSGTTYKYDYKTTPACHSTCWQVSSIPTQTQTIILDVPYCGVLPAHSSSVEIRTLCVFENIGSKRIVYSVDKDGTVYVWEQRHNKQETLNGLGELTVGAFSGLIVALVIAAVSRALGSKAVTINPETPTTTKI